MLHKIKYFFYRYHLNKRLKTHQAIHEFGNLNDAETIGILFDCTDVNIITAVGVLVRKLEKHQKQVTLLGYVEVGQDVSEMMFPTFDSKATNWYFLPNSEELKAFADNNFDILISLFLADIPTLEYMSTFSNASFRVGPHLPSKQYCFDFMVNNNTDSLNDFVKNIYHYLQMISPTTKPTN